MRVTVKYYAAARELAGCREAVFDFLGETATQENLWVELSQRHPALAPYVAAMRLAINGDFADDTQPLHDGDTVDLLPPVAGGSSRTRCTITTDPISLDAAWRAVAHPGAGAVAVFTGVVRDHAEGQPVVRLDYEAHEELATKEMKRVLDAVATAHPGVRLFATHRIGELAVGDVAVAIAASAPHRTEAFDACRQAIDRIKETVPIWKKEWGSDRDAAWVNLESSDDE